MMDATTCPYIPYPYPYQCDIYSDDDEFGDTRVYFHKHKVHWSDLPVVVRNEHSISTKSSILNAWSKEFEDWMFMTLHSNFVSEIKNRFNDDMADGKVHVYGEVLFTIRLCDGILTYCIMGKFLPHNERS